MALAISDLQYDLLTLARTYDRANDFTRRDEYDRLTREIARHDQEWEEAIEEVESESAKRWELWQDEQHRADTNQRTLATIAGICREALDSAAERDDIDDNEAALLDALSRILSHAEA